MIKNYYSIHPNKTKRKKVSRKLSWKTLKTIALVTDVVMEAMRLMQIRMSSYQPIPKYSVCGGNDKPEIVIDKKGVLKANVSTSKGLADKIRQIQEKNGNIPILETLEIDSESMHKTLGYSATEFAKNLKTVADEMSDFEEFDDKLFVISLDKKQSHPTVLESLLDSEIVLEYKTINGKILNLGKSKITKNDHNRKKNQD